MKLKCKALLTPYIASGTKICRQKNMVSKIESHYTMKPAMPSLLNFSQKIQFKRNINDLKIKVNSLYNFLKDSSELFNDFELIFDSRMKPYSIINYKKKWKDWVKLMQILSAKYEGDWVERILGKITYKVSDENRLLKNLIDDYVLSELYSRDIYNIKFNNRNRCQRNWVETVFGVPLIFKQDCEFVRTSRFDILKIRGEVDIDIKKNIDNIILLCSIYDINIEDIAGIKQETIYEAFDLESYPVMIKSKFNIEGEELQSIRNIEIDITLKEVLE